MAKPWLRSFRHKDGSQGFWINDIRDGKFVSIPAGTSKPEAEMKLEQYKIRRDIEKEGYDDQYADLTQTKL